MFRLQRWPGAPSHLNGNSIFITFDKGYFFAWDDWTRGENTLYGPDGQKLYQVVIKPTDSRRTLLMSVAVGSDRTLAVSYQNWPCKGTEYGAIALFDTTGKVTRFINTGPYFATHICFAPDHSIWIWNSLR